METIRLVFESSTPITINNQLSVDSFPFAMDWFNGAELPTISHPHKVINITPTTKVIRIDSHPEKLPVTRAASFFMFPKRYIVELGSDDATTYFTIYSKSSDKLAINLGTKVTDCQIKQENNKIVLTSKNLNFIFNPITNRVEQHQKTWTDAPIPLLFLNHLKNKNLADAKKLLSFDITDKALSEYFGEFDILLNNYLNIPNVFSIIQGDKVKNLTFTIEDNKISNIE